MTGQKILNYEKDPRKHSHQLSTRIRSFCASLNAKIALQANSVCWSEEEKIDLKLQERSVCPEVRVDEVAMET